MALAFEGIDKGSLLKVGCIQSLTCVVAEGEESVHLERDPINPIQVYDLSGKEFVSFHVQGREVTFSLPFPGGFITYRPFLMMLVREYTLKIDEWGVTVGWTLELEEV